MHDLTFLFFRAVPTPRSPSKVEAKLPGGTDEVKKEDSEAGISNSEASQVKTQDSDIAAKTEDDAKPTLQELDSQAKTENGDSSDQKPVKPEEAENGIESDMNKVAGQDEMNGKAAEDTEAKKGEEDSVMVPGNPSTLFIKSLSPEISRADLEAVCLVLA